MAATAPEAQRGFNVLPSPLLKLPKDLLPMCQLPEPTYLSDAAARPGSSCLEPCLAGAPHSQTHIPSCHHSPCGALAMAMGYRSFPYAFCSK